MGHQVDFILFVPPAWNSLGQAIYFATLVEYVAQIARLIVGLVAVVSVEMAGAIDCSGQFRSIIFDSMYLP